MSLERVKENYLCQELILEKENLWKRINYRLREREKKNFCELGKAKIFSECVKTIKHNGKIGMTIVFL